MPNRKPSSPKRARSAAKPKRFPHLAYVVEQGPVSVMLTDVRGNIEYVNSRFTEITGYTLDEIAGKTIQVLASDDMPSAVYAQMWQTLSAGKEWRGELHSRKKTGESYWVSMVMTPLVNRRGKHAHFLTLAEDITERKRIQDDLRASDHQLRALFEHVPDGLYRSSPDGKLLAANPALVRMLGYASEAELLNVDIGRELYADPQQRTLMTHRLEQAGDLPSSELILTRKDGRQLVVLDSAHTVRDEQGRVLYYEGTLTDITERKKTEIALDRYAAILNAVNFAAEQFLRVPSWRAQIDAVMARLGQATQVSRVYIFQNRWHAGKLVWTQLYEWSAPGVDAQIAKPVLQEFDVVAEGFGRWIDVMAKGDWIASNVKDLPLGEQTELRTQHIQSIVCVPILVRQAWWGFIGFDDCVTERKWSAAEIDALVAAADTLGAAIEREQSDEELRDRAAELEAIRQASLMLTAQLDLQAVLDAMVDTTLHLINGAEDAHIYLYRDGALQFGTALWTNGSKGAEWSPPRQNGLTYTVARTGEKIVVPNMQTHPLFAGVPWEGAIIGLPLKIAQRVVGVMTIACKNPREFSDHELRSLDLLAAQAAIAIENASLYERVHQLALTDSLTNIYNRRGFFQIGESELERARRFGHPLSVLMFDLDHFKRINDTHGHPFGDKVLAALIEICRHHIRTVDILGRYGGEEFMVLLPEADVATALQIAERVRTAVEQAMFDIDGKKLKLTISIGVATLDDHIENLNALFDRADQALYRAKQAGRNCVQGYL